MLIVLGGFRVRPRFGLVLAARVLIQQFGQFRIPIDSCALGPLSTRLSGSIRISAGSRGTRRNFVAGRLAGQFRQQIRVRPLRVTAFHPEIRVDSRPQIRRFPDALGTQLQSQQRFESPLRRPPDRALATHHFTQLIQMRQVRHAGLPRDAIGPALHERQQLLEAYQRLTLLRCIGDGHVGEVHRAGEGIRVHDFRIAQLLLHRVQINACSACVLADKRLESRHKPRNRSEQPGMRFFLQREEGEHFALVDIKRTRVFNGVLRDQPARRIIEQRHALVETAADFMRQIAGGMAQLHGE